MWRLEENQVDTSHIQALQCKKSVHRLMMQSSLISDKDIVIYNKNEISYSRKSLPAVISQICPHSLHKYE